MTDEMAIGHYFKRATMIESAFGSTDHHLARYEVHSVGRAGQHEEYWIPAEELAAFNASIVGPIEVIAELHGPAR